MRPTAERSRPWALEVKKTSAGLRAAPCAATSPIPPTDCRPGRNLDTVRQDATSTAVNVYPRGSMRTSLEHVSHSSKRDLGSKIAAAPTQGRHELLTLQTSEAGVSLEFVPVPTAGRHTLLCHRSCASVEPFNASRRARQSGMTWSMSWTKRSPWPRSWK